MVSRLLAQAEQLNSWAWFGLASAPGAVASILGLAMPFSAGVIIPCPLRLSDNGRSHTPTVLGDWSDTNGRIAATRVVTGLAPWTAGCRMGRP